MPPAVSTSFQDEKLKIASHEDLESSDYAMPTNFIIGFIWSHHNVLLRPLQCGVTNYPGIYFWAEELHS